MRRDKEQCFELRKQGKTYREIETLMNVSRSTLCDWFKNEEWSKHAKRINTEKHIKISTEHLRKLNAGRILRLEKRYLEAEEEAIKTYEIYKNNPLFAAGLMLYAGEGDKRSKGAINFANVDFSLHKIFIRFMLKFLGVKQDEIKFGLLLYPDLEIDVCRDTWSKELNIQIENFHKPQVIQGRLKTRKLHFGVGSIIISSVYLKRKLLKWIELSKIHLSN